MTRQEPDPARPPCETLLRRFDTAADRDPAAIAVRTGEPPGHQDPSAAPGPAHLTYGALADASRALADRLTPLVADRPGPVAVLLGPGPAQAAAALAALRCGKPYLPIDPAYPPHRVDRVLTDAAPAALVTAPAPSDSVRPGGGPAVRVTAGTWGDDTRVTAEDAYVIYTSGSTGTPKGVVVGHRGILNLLDASEARRALPPRSRCATCASPGFDAAVLEMWTALTTGGELVVTPESGRWNAEGFAGWLARERVAHAYVPAAFLPAVADGLRHGLDLSALRRIIVAVEPIPRGLLGAVKRALPGLTLINGYGPTEAAVCVTMYEVTADDTGSERTPIGTPISGVRLRVEPPVNAEHAPAPGEFDGSWGELHIGGVQVGRPLRQPDGAQAAFYTRTAPDGTPEPWYRSGDLVRRDADGTYTFLGRADDMVKIRGYRVEPGDVEHALLDQPGLAQAVVLTTSSADGGPDRLVAHVVPEPGARPTAAAVRRGLRERLPWYAVPHQVVIREAFPRTAHGKIDREALAATPATPPRPPQTAPEPAIPADPVLLRLWKDVLPAADPAASFLACGGDSLAAGRMAALLRTRHGRDVRMLDILLAEDLDALRRAVDDAPPAPPDDEPAPATGPRAALPATYGQRGLWFHDTLHPGSPVYNEPLALSLRGPLDTDALTRALSALVARHEALRTGLVMAGGELRQEVHPPAPVGLITRDLRHVPDGQRESAVADAVRAAVREPFDLAAGPHLRCHLLRRGERDHLLLLVLHHSAFDGGSADVLFDELAALHTAYTCGEDVRLPPPTEQFADHARRQQAAVADGRLDDDIAYWRERLAGLPETLDLPADLPRPRAAGGDGALIRDRLPRRLTADIDALARDAGVTRFTVLLAALHLLLARHCGTGDVAVGTPFSGRDHPGAERAVGYYLNTLPLRADLHGDPTFRRLLARTRRTVADAYTHQRVPYGHLVERLGSTAPADNPYLQVCLVPEDVYRHDMEFAGLTSTFEYHDTGIAKFDLTVSLIPDPGGGLRLTAEYRTDLFRSATVERLLGHLRTLLESATAHPDDPVATLEMLPAAERARILGDFAGDAAPHPQPHATVHELVTRQAERTPDAVAVETAGERLTYGELLRRADQLADHLAEHGAEPGTHVGVRLPRGTDAVVAFLAVLKTGAAYVPLDPAHPERRLAFMAGDAGLVLEVTPELLDENREIIADGPESPPAVATGAEDTAYVVYTSGSTGPPKGVAIPHRAVTDLALGAADWAGVGEASALLLVASLSFDMATFDLWAALVHGARLVLAPPGPLTPDRLAGAVARHGLTHADLPTALFHRLAEEDPGAFAGLTTVLSGGEVLDPALAARVLRAAPGLRLINGYGPTETTTYATYHVLDDPAAVEAPVPLGRPTPRTRARVLDPHGRPVPAGVTGELHLGGPGLATGYLNRPGATAERFRPDPFGAPGETLYATGDLARWRPDGTLAYAGRLDAQFKLHGHRVEPGEIEAVLRAHPGVAQAVVIRREDRPGHPHLAAYVTAMSQPPPTAWELTDHVAARLPAHLVPRAVTLLDRLPVTEGGKTDRAALPAPTRPARPDGGSPARIEDRVTLIWRDVLTLDALDPDERLFDIGGASLHATLIHRRTAEEFGLTGLRVIDLFEHATARAYAAHVARLLGQEGADQP